MPIYEFHCQKCNTTFEEWLKMSEEKEPQICPECNALAQRQVSQTSFVLKGSGWYVTEYGKNSASGSTNSSANTNKTSEEKTNQPQNTNENSADSTSTSAQSVKNTETKSTTSDSSQTSSNKTSNTTQNSQISASVNKTAV